MIFPDFFATWIRFMKWIRIREDNMKRIQTDPDTEHWFATYLIYCININPPPI